MLNRLIILSIIGSNHLFSDDSWKVYDDSEVAEIHITVAPEDLEWIYENVHSDSLHPATIHFQNIHINETIEDIGFRIRGNTSRTSAKKSFKIDFNHFSPGRNFYGTEKLNLNGEHNDPSIIRSKICWDLYQRAGIISSRASHANVYINGEYYGLYISIEHIDDSFIERNFDDNDGNLWKCLWPADLSYRGDNEEDYHPYYDDKRPYELKTNKEEYDYSKLARLIRIINHTPDSLEMVLDIKSTLQYFAMNIVTGSWDDYRFLKNNYYLYHIPSSDKIHWIPYDYDNTLSIDWFNIDWSTINPYEYPSMNNESRPLTDYLFSQPRYRTLLSHFIQFYLDHTLDQNYLDNYFTPYPDSLIQYAELDNYRTLDYGFSLGDFIDSYGDNYSNQHVKQGISEFLSHRISSLNNQLVFEDESPIIYNVNLDQNNITLGDEIQFSIAMVNEPINFNLIYIKEGETDWQSALCEYSPDVSSNFVQDHDKWITTLIPDEVGTYYWYFYASNTSGTERYPTHDFYQFNVTQVDDSSTVLINEFLAKNESVNVDENSEYDDWVELWNNSATVVDLSNHYLTDNPENFTKWEFPSGTLIQPNDFLLIWCDDDEEQGPLHTNFKLSANGEFLALVESDGNTIKDSLTFPAQEEDISYGRTAEDFTVWDFMEPTPGSHNESLSIDNDPTINQFKIANIYPNPFNSSLTVRLKTNETIQNVSIKLFSILGKTVTEVLAPNIKNGENTITLNVSNASLSTGVYFVQIKSNNFSDFRKVMYLK